MAIEQIFRTEWPKIVATLVRDFGDIELAEDCAQEAFTIASEKWGTEVAVPAKPGAWLTTTARRKAIDRVRRTSSYEEKLHELEARTRHGTSPAPTGDLVDQQLALLLGCCHPALSLDAQVALTLRLVAGLTTEQIAQAFLVENATMGKRLTRAKTKVRDAGIPFGTVNRHVLAERAEAVRHVIYLIFTEGHASRTADEFVRGDLCDEAVWLASLLADLLPDDSENHGLRALILFTDARRATRVDDEGMPTLLEDQDRSQWDTDKINNGLGSLRRAIDLGSLGRFALQALVASLHAASPSFETTDWARIVRTYDMLLQVDDSAVVRLNRAVAVSYAEGPEAGLREIQPLEAALADYVYLHSARAELLARLGRDAEAVAAYDRALGANPSRGERRFLERRRALISGPQSNP